MPRLLSCENFDLGAGSKSFFNLSTTLISWVETFICKQKLAQIDTIWFFLQYSAVNIVSRIMQKKKKTKKRRVSMWFRHKFSEIEIFYLKLKEVLKFKVGNFMCK